MAICCKSRGTGDEALVGELAGLFGRLDLDYWYPSWPVLDMDVPRIDPNQDCFRGLGVLEPDAVGESDRVFDPNPDLHAQDK